MCADRLISAYIADKKNRLSPDAIFRHAGFRVSGPTSPPWADCQQFHRILAPNLKIEALAVWAPWDRVGSQGVSAA
jgi:hypothetical protein